METLRSSHVVLISVARRGWVFVRLRGKGGREEEEKGRGCDR